MTSLTTKMSDVIVLHLPVLQALIIVSHSCSHFCHCCSHPCQSLFLLLSFKFSLLPLFVCTMFIASYWTKKCNEISVPHFTTFSSSERSQTRSWQSSSSERRQSRSWQASSSERRQSRSSSAREARPDLDSPAVVTEGGPDLGRSDRH